ncbi:MAG TPA: alanine racemase [Actinomycetota bacterium]|nr:alanine racemase [Actinomycetota bacterium]
MTGSFRPTWVEVDLEAIRHNARLLKPPGSDLMAVVKANGYGHGDVEVARAAIEAGATWCGVALVEEGLRLRAAGVEVPILVLSELPAGSEAVALAHRLTPTLYTEPGLERLSAAARGRVGVHVKIDTGMHRVGVWPPEETPAFVRRVRAAGLELEGLCTHFACAEDDEVLTKEQLSTFLEAEEAVRAGGDRPLCHTANTAATILYPETHLDLVRPGIGLYGILPAPGVGAKLGLRPALRWQSEVASVSRLPAGEATSYGHRYRLDRDAWIATVPVGYADGYPRQLTNVGEVLIGGGRHPIAGTVTMDQLVVDCGDREVHPGDEVVLIGTQGEETIGADELGRSFGTIGYEIVSRIGQRVPRRHV